MGVKLGTGGAFGGRRRGDDDLVEAHEINVTPFIDVMLVLLIIFMVAAPLATVDLGVDLPASTAEPQRDAFLEAVVEHAAGERGLTRRRLDDLRHRIVAVAARLLDLGELGVALELADPLPGQHGLAADLDGLGEPDRPGRQRGEGEPDHHGLHDDVGALEHAPGREVAR
ncbi:MAG: biopolymer transporter ExbD [Bradyrhizobium sp.]|uniref:biopolymer transporter ExbD n=1 Tax=Bradyrhizobium sp. TaxID=376 RepID=UPI00391C7B4E